MSGGKVATVFPSAFEPLKPRKLTPIFNTQTFKMSNPVKHQLTLDLSESRPPLRDAEIAPESLPDAKESKTLSSNSDETGNATLRFIGTATTILEWEGIRIMTDPNFLHAGDHVHLGPGVTGTRKTNPAVDIGQLPRIDVVLLSHYHADHFDQVVEASLRRDLPIVTTPHAKEHLSEKKSDDEKFTQVYDLDFFENAMLDIKGERGEGDKATAIKVTGMPGKHVPPGPLSIANDLLAAVPPTNGWMVELGYNPQSSQDAFECGYRIYISGDTLMIDELKEIPERYKDQNIDLMLVHLGGTTIPSPSLPLLMVTMDAKQGVQLMQLIRPDVTIPIHYDDYDVFLSPLEDFKKAVDEAGLGEKVVYLERGDEYKFLVRS